MYAVVKNVFRNNCKQYNHEFNDTHMMLLVYMQRFRNLEGEINFSLDWMFKKLGIGYKLQKEVIKALKDLVDFGLITIIDTEDKINKNTWLQVRVVKYDDSFTTIGIDIFDKIFSLDLDIRRKKTMLFLYVILKSYIDSKGFCYPTLVTLMGDLGIKKSYRMVNDTLVALKKHGLIDYANVGQTFKDNGIQRANNIYTLCEIENYQEILKNAIELRKQMYEDENIKYNDKPTLKRKVKTKQPNIEVAFAKEDIIAIEEPSKPIYKKKDEKFVESENERFLQGLEESNDDTDCGESETLQYLKVMQSGNTDDLLPWEM